MIAMSKFGHMGSMWSTIGLVLFSCSDPATANSHNSSSPLLSQQECSFLKETRIELPSLMRLLAVSNGSDGKCFDSRLATEVGVSSDCNVNIEKRTSDYVLEWFAPGVEEKSDEVGKMIEVEAQKIKSTTGLSYISPNGALNYPQRISYILIDKDVFERDRRGFIEAYIAREDLLVPDLREQFFEEFIKNSVGFCQTFNLSTGAGEIVHSQVIIKYSGNLSDMESCVETQTAAAFGIDLLRIAREIPSVSDRKRLTEPVMAKILLKLLYSPEIRNGESVQDALSQIGLRLTQECFAP
jgi:hypothetical protein